MLFIKVTTRIISKKVKQEKDMTKKDFKTQFTFSFSNRIIHFDPVMKELQSKNLFINNCKNREAKKSNSRAVLGTQHPNPRTPAHFANCC